MFHAPLPTRLQLCLALLLIAAGATALHAGQRHVERRREAEVFDPTEFPIPPWRHPYVSPWGPGMTLDYGFWSPTSGSWEALLKTGLSTSIAGTWKYADWTGDLLPPSSTLFSVGYRYSYHRGDSDIQLFQPNGAVNEIQRLKLYLLEAGVTQRFPILLNGHCFIDTGATLGLGGASGQITAAAPDPTKIRRDVPSLREDGFLMRGAVNAGVGLQYFNFDLRFLLEAGVTGSDALGGGFRSQGDVGMRLGGTIYFWD